MWKKEWGVRKHYSSSGRASIPFTCFCYLDFHASQHIDRKDNFVGFLQRLCRVKPFSVISVTDSLMKLIEWYWRMTKKSALKKKLQLIFFAISQLNNYCKKAWRREIHATSSKYVFVIVFCALKTFGMMVEVRICNLQFYAVFNSC